MWLKSMQIWVLCFLSFCRKQLIVNPLPTPAVTDCECAWQTTREVAKLLGAPVELNIKNNVGKYLGIAASSKLKRDTW